MYLIAWLVLLLTAEQAMPTDSWACPSDMTAVQTGTKHWCVKYYDTAVTFCDAARTCHKNGLEMISKPVHDAMKASSHLTVNKKWWVGLVDALNERSKWKDGWIWIKDRQVTTSTDNIFNSDEPDNNSDRQDCVTIKSTSSKLLMDETCTKLNAVYCYSDPAVANRVASTPSQGKFKLVEISEFQQPAPGCWIKEPRADTNFRCSQACLQFEFGDCVGFYWHLVRRQCILLPYFDASLPLDSAEFSANSAEMLQWRKYILMED